MSIPPPAKPHDDHGDSADWWVFRGPAELPEPPLWRRSPTARRAAGEPHHYLLGADETSVVNAALQLRRPLLVTGRPGTGKSSLARAVAQDLGLGDVLRWPVNSRSTLMDALYRYDAVGRLREASLRREREVARGHARRIRRRPGGRSDIGNYLRLGPLGTALAAVDRPRVLLVDELDKSDIDLPNDLLVVLEEGEFEIPELARLPEHQQDVDVLVTGDRERVRVRRGLVSCGQFPVIVMTSNGEREFPPAFLRRCVRLELREPDAERLRGIIRHHLGEDALAVADDLIAAFVQRSSVESLATDQLLAAVHLRITGADLSRDALLGSVMRRLDENFTV
ncbi:AAA family ATPase [Streptomyces sp. NPDC057638]|uniref:AAA family ATPase n=1 Tax=Streptomyces sp. NPDC057638 TaxID=3346190 RepID=UPI00369C3B6D